MARALFCTDWEPLVDIFEQKRKTVRAVGSILFNPFWLDKIFVYSFCLFFVFLILT